MPTDETRVKDALLVVACVLIGPGLVIALWRIPCHRAEHKTIRRPDGGV